MMNKNVVIVCMMIIVLVFSVGALGSAYAIKASSTFGILQIDRTEYDVTYVNSTTVNVSGSINNLISGDTKVTIVFTLPDGSTKGSELTANSDGTFQTTLSIDSNSEMGTYAVSATYGSTPIGALVFSVKQIQSPIVSTTNSLTPQSSQNTHSSGNVIQPTQSATQTPLQSQSSSKIPNWVRNIFLWYGQGQISENELLGAIKFLIQDNIINIGSSSNLSSHNTSSMQTFQSQSNSNTSSDNNSSLNNIHTIFYDSPTELIDPNPTAGDRFGWSVSVANDKALVGDGGGGVAYLYNIKDGSITKMFKNPDTQGSFGISAVISDKYALFSSDMGKAFLFDIQRGNLLQSFQDPKPPSQWDYEKRFGKSIFIVGENIFIGAPAENAVYLFDATSGKLVQTFQNPTNNTNSLFGTSISSNANLVVVGAPANNSAYIFDLTSGKLLGTIGDPQLTQGDSFGNAVFLSGNNLLISDSGKGSVYLFDATKDAWLKTFSPSPPSTNFGYSIAMEGNNVVIGSPYALDGLYAYCNNPGKVFLFDSTTGNLLKTFFDRNYVSSIYSVIPSCSFGYSVSISDSVIFASGAGLNVNNPSGAGEIGINGDVLIFHPSSQGHFPTIKVPNDIVVSPDNPTGTAVVSFSANATDLQGNSLLTTCDPPSGSIFLKGTTLVTCSATDFVDNTGSATFHVIVK